MCVCVNHVVVPTGLVVCSVYTQCVVPHDNKSNSRFIRIIFPSVGSGGGKSGGRETRWKKKKKFLACFPDGYIPENVRQLPTVGLVGGPHSLEITMPFFSLSLSVCVFRVPVFRLYTCV